MLTRVTAPDVARRLCAHLESFRPTPDALRRAKRLVRAQRRKRGEPPGRKGHEYVVEALLRPVVTRLAARMLGVKSPDKLPCRIYSSHFHTTEDSDEIWRQRFACFRWIHPSVDTYDEKRHMRRADLFIGMAIDQLVSVEFKYVPPRRIPNAKACAKQVRQYLSRHKACLLVIYAGQRGDEPRDPNDIRDIREEIKSLVRRKHAFVAVLPGPAVTFP